MSVIDLLQYVTSALLVIYAVLFTSNYVYQVLFNLVFGINSHRYYTIKDYFESSFDFTSNLVALAVLGYLVVLFISRLNVFAWGGTLFLTILGLHCLLFVALHLEENVGTKVGLKAYLRSAKLVTPGDIALLLWPAIVFALGDQLLPESLPLLVLSVDIGRSMVLGIVQYYCFVANMAILKARIMIRDSTFEPIFAIRFKRRFANLLPSQAGIRIVNSTSKYLFIYSYQNRILSVVERRAVLKIEYFLDRISMGG